VLAACNAEKAGIFSGRGDHRDESACLKILRHADFAFNARIGHPPTVP